MPEARFGRLGWLLLSVLVFLLDQGSKWVVLDVIPKHAVGPSYPAGSI